MAEIVGAFIMPHVPLTLAEPQAAPEHKRAAVFAGYDRIAGRMREIGVDTVISIGADHYGMFGPGCVPQCLIGAGDVDGPMEAWLGVEHGPIPTNEPLAQHILRDGHATGIDWAFAKSLTVDHATMVPYHFCTRHHPNVRTIPVYLNEAVPPFIPSRRAWQIGDQIRRAVQSFPGADRVAVFGTGGISHWVGTAEMGQVNEAFDRRVLAQVERGDVESLIALSDEEILREAGNGALEIKSWICAMAAVPGFKAELIAYEAVPEWVCGFGFAELKAA